MALVLTIDNLGKRYGLLPSRVLCESSTFDLYIMDMAMTYENYINQKSRNDGLEPPDVYDTQQLSELLHNVRTQNAGTITS